MKILGVSCNYHDASAALVVDGQVVAAAAEERFSRQKHDPSFPTHAIRYCLREAGIKSSEIDLVAFHEDPATKLTRTLTTSFSNFPWSLGTFLKTAREATSTGLRVQNDLSRHLGIDIKKVICTPHHMSHAAHAFLTSPFEEATIITLDAVGEWTSSAIFRASRKSGLCKFEPLDISGFPHSLGLAYSAFTSFLGFKVNDGECSTMALAAFGKPSYLEQVREVIKISPDGTHEVNEGWFDLRGDVDVPVTKKFISVFGPPRHFKKKYLFDCFDKVGSTYDAEAQRYADIACSVQLVLEEGVLAYARRAKTLSGMSNLTYAGGVALNCVANARLVQSKIFDEVYIPPDPGDGGGAMGAALYMHSLREAKKTPIRSFSPYYGEALIEQELDEVFPHLTPESWAQFSLLHPQKPGELKWREFSDEKQMLEWVAAKINIGCIVGWCQGRFENGPRALGNRSILIRPDNIELARRLSKRVKLREAFRPYAASLTEKAAIQYLVITTPLELTARWMQSSYKVKKEGQSALGAAIHYDKTTRPHCASPADNPRYHQLLVEVGKLTGAEAVLNTSFNESGYPLVASATDALMMFARTDLDVLVFGLRVIEKIKKNPAGQVNVVESI